MESKRPNGEPAAGPRRDGLGVDPGRERVVRAVERHRIARDLHDSTSQLLAVMQLQLGRLKRESVPEARALIDECERTIREIHEQIRALDLD